MADKPFDRTIINVRERPLSSDIDKAQSQLDYALRFAMRGLLASGGSPLTGFLDTGISVVPNSPVGMSVIVKAGLGFADAPSDVPSAIGGIVGVDDLSSYKPLVLLTDQTINVDAADPTNGRYDIIEVKHDRRAENPLSRDILNTSTGVFEPASVNKTLAFSLDGRTGRVVSPANSTTGIGYKVGIASGSPVEPSTSPGYTKVATIFVAAAVTTITAGAITDRRTIWIPSKSYIDARGWNRVVSTVDTTGSVVASDIAGLSFAAASGKKYLVRAVLFAYAQSLPTGFGVSIKSAGAPATSAQFYAHSHFSTANQFGQLRYAAFLDTPFVPADSLSADGTAPQTDGLDAYFVTTGAGTIQLRLNTASANIATVKAGSYLEFLEL